MTYQSRTRQIIALVRLDICGSPHRNPDDEEVHGSHIHMYREGFGVKWAFPLPHDRFMENSDRWQLLQDFMDFCNIIDPPIIQRSLFS